MKANQLTRWAAVVVLVGCTAGVTAGASPAAAGKVRKHPTTSSLNFSIYRHEAVIGAVGSPAAKCVNGRTVKVFKVRKKKPDLLLGTDRKTGNSGWEPGFWKVRTSLRSGKKYYAVVLAKSYRAGGKQHLCRSYRTPKVTLHLA